MLEALSLMRSAISKVVRFPVHNHTILGGAPLRADMSKKSASKVTIVKSFCLAYCHITGSSQSFRPTDRTWRQSAKLSGSNRIIRNEMFWSNSNFISNVLQATFSLRCESKTGKNILPCQFREVGKNIIVAHIFRQPSKHIVNRDSGVSNTWLTKTLLRINSDNVVKIVHNITLLHK